MNFIYGAHLQRRKTVFDYVHKKTANVVSIKSAVTGKWIHQKVFKNIQQLSNYATKHGVKASLHFFHPAGHTYANINALLKKAAEHGVEIVISGR